MPSQERCRSCGAPIIWARTKLGKPFPLDAVPTKDGRFQLERGIARHRGRLGGEVSGPLEPKLYTSHFATCPDAGKWRRPIV